jgi:uncharacterized protein (TIRG00374 family)
VNARLVFWVNLAVGTAVLAFMLVTYGGGAQELLRANSSPLLVSAFLALVGLSIGCLSWRWGYLIRGLTPAPSLGVLVLYRSAAHTLAVLVPSGKLGGDPLRAWLATRSGVSAGRAIASVAIDRTVEIGATAPFSILFATLLLQHGIPQLREALVTIVIVTIGLCVGVWLAVRRLRRGTGLVTALLRSSGADRFDLIGSRMEIIESAERAATDLVEEPRRLVVAFLAGVLANVFVLAEFWLLLSAFDLPATSTAVVGAIFATAAAHMLPIPAGIGVLEGAQVWMFGMLGYPVDVGLAVGLLVRMRELLWMAPGLAYMLTNSLSASLARARHVDRA